MTKREQIEYIIEETRKVSRDKNEKSRERKLSAARIHLLKSTEAQVEALYHQVKENGAEATFGKK